MDDEYTYERVEDKHVEYLRTISTAAFKLPVKRSYFINKWRTDFTGHKNLGYIAFSKSGEPAAYYGVFPCFVEYNGEKFLAAQSGDTMTHPNHGGKGLFTKLAKLTYNLAQEEGVQFVFGFPNDNSYPGFVKKLNWTHDENLNTYKVNVTTLPVAGFFKKFKVLMPLYKLYLKIILLFFKPTKSFLENSINKKNIVSVYHDKKFFDYKLFQDNFLMKVNGIHAWLKTDGWLLVGDIEKKENLDLNILIKKLKFFAAITGHTKLVFSVSSDTWLDILIKEKLKPETGAYVGYVNFTSSLPLQNMKFTLADLDTF